MYDVHGLSPNCCAVNIFEYSTTEITLPSCLLDPSERVASQRKWQSTDLDLLKLAKKRKSVWPALFRGNVCIKSDKISNVSAILGRKCTARLKVNQNTRSFQWKNIAILFKIGLLLARALCYWCLSKILLWSELG